MDCVMDELCVEGHRSRRDVVDVLVEPGALERNRRRGGPALARPYWEIQARRSDQLWGKRARETGQEAQKAATSFGERE